MDFQTYAVRELSAVAEKLADTSKRQLDATTAQMTATFDATIDRLRADQSELVIENERLTAENAALSWEKDQLLESAKTASPAAHVDRLLDVFEAVARSTSVNDVLIATARGLAADFGRVAVFVGDSALIQVGADAPLNPASSPAVAAPITVRGDTLATIYADDEVRAGEGARMAEVLKRHATLALDRLTIELKAIGELRAYAQMLLDEVEYVFNADLTANVNEADRLVRLKENLRCARQIYGQRVTLDGPGAAAVLDQVIERVVETKADTAFGRELLDAATDVPSAPSPQNATP